MINIFDLEVLDATAQGRPGYFESELNEIQLEIQLSYEDRRILSEFLDGILPQKFGIWDHSHAILRVSNDDTEFGLKLIDCTMWVGKKATIKH